MRKKILHERSDIMKATVVSALGLMLLLNLETVTQAEDQRPMDPYSNCTTAQQSIPGAAACTGFLYCMPQSNGTDVMCCHNNDHGGKDCEYIGTTAAFTQPKGGLRAPVGQLQNAPVTAPPKSSTPKAPETGATTKGVTR